VSRTIGNRGPRVSFFLQETLELKALVRTTITPKKEEDFVSITSEGPKASHKKTDLLGRNMELESLITKPGHIEVCSNASNGGLKDEAHRLLRKPEFAAAKSSNKNEGGTN